MHTIMLCSFRRVLDRDEMIADQVGMPSEARRACSHLSINACLNDGSLKALATTRAPLMRTDLGLVSLDDEIEGGKGSS